MSSNNIVSEIKLDESKIIGKVTNDNFGLLVSKTWKDLIDPYTPWDTGMLMHNVEKKPFLLHYKEPYAHYIYIGKLYVDPETRSSWARKGVKKVATDKDLIIKNGYSYWDKHTLAINRQDIEKEVQAYANRRSK